MSTPTSFADRRADAYNAINRDEPVSTTPVMEAPKVFTPSSYQQAYFDHTLKGEEDLFVDAVAGSGKTSTIVEAANKLPMHLQHNAAFVAFNKDIAKSLAQRLPSSVTSSTIHSLGFRAMCKAYPGKGDSWRSAYKSSRIAQLWCKQHRINTFKPAGREISDYLADAATFSMLTLVDVQNVSAIAQMVNHFDLTTPPALTDWLQENFGDLRNFNHFEWLSSVIADLIEWGISGAPIADVNGCDYRIEHAISFDDMVYLPVRLELRLPEFQRVFVDETQDLNAAQREFVFKLRGVEGRMSFVGDPRQSIYGFTGADVHSFETISQKTGARRLPLSICYRCPSDILSLAREIVPHIEAAPWAKAGIVSECRMDDVWQRVKGGEMIICRITAPLIELAFKLIAHDIAAIVRGRDIGTSLIKVIASVENSLYYTWPRFGAALDAYESNMRSVLLQKEDNESQISSLEDRCQSVRTIYTNLCAKGRLRDAQDLKKYIEQLFSDETKGVILSTVHKAKGLEAETVYILHPELMPFPRAKKPWQIEQEMNLKYVALTRAKHELVFVGE